MNDSDKMKNEFGELDDDSLEKVNGGLMCEGNDGKEHMVITLWSYCQANAGDQHVFASRDKCCSTAAWDLSNRHQCGTCAYYDMRLGNPFCRLLDPNGNII